MRKFTAAAVLVVGAVGIAGGTAGAEPSPSGPPAAVAADHQETQVNGVPFTVDRDGGSVVVASRDGVFRTEGGTVVAEDGHGTVLGSLPLTYRKDNLVFPIAAEFGDHSVRMTPALTGGTPVADPITPEDIARGHDITPGHPQADPIAESFTPRDQNELALFSSRAWLSSFTGAVVGAIVGAGVGCVAGAIAGSVTTAITTLFAGVLPGAVVGCIAGVALIGSVGTLLGAVLVAGPIGLWSAYQYFSTILSPCTTPGTYCADPAAPPKK